jgi:hypothetical protein
MNKSREAFEDSKSALGGDLTLRINGDYYNFNMQDSWNLWQEACAWKSASAVVPEAMIIDDEPNPESTESIARVEGWNECRDLCLRLTADAQPQAIESEESVGVITSINSMDCTFTAVYHPDTNGVTPKAFDKIGQKVYTEPTVDKKSIAGSALIRELERKSYHNGLTDVINQLCDVINQMLEGNLQTRYGLPEPWKTTYERLSAFFRTTTDQRQVCAVVPEGIKCSERLPTEDDLKGQLDQSLQINRDLVEFCERPVMVATLARRAKALLSGDGY